MENLNEVRRKVNGDLMQSLRDLQKLVEEVMKVEAPTYVDFHYGTEGLEVDHE